MTYQYIILEKKDGAASITLNRPDKLNSMDALILQELMKALDDLREDDNIKALIFTGAGRAFCSGADLTATVRATDPKQPGINRPVKLEPFISFGAVMKRVKAMPKPVIAAVNGIAAGAGFALACNCDIRIASENARFSSIFVKRGLVADCGLTYTLPRLVGIANALELMWTGDIIDAKKAEAIGLVSRVVPHSELMKAATEFALKLAKGPSIAIELMKKLTYDGLEANNFAAQLAYECWAQDQCHMTDDNKEGVKSFLEKREPHFKGM